MVNIGRKHKIILMSDKPKEYFIGLAVILFVAVMVDIPAPVAPVLLRRVVGIKACRLHIRKMVSPDKIRKKPFKAITRIGHARGGRQAGPSADQYRLRCFNGFFQPADLSAYTVFFCHHIFKRQPAHLDSWFIISFHTSIIKQRVPAVKKAQYCGVVSKWKLLGFYRLFTLNFP